MSKKPSLDKKGQPPKAKELKKHKKMKAEIVAGSNPTCRGVASGEAGTKPISKSKAFVFAPKWQI